MKMLTWHVHAMQKSRNSGHPAIHKRSAFFLWWLMGTWVPKKVMEFSP